MKPYVFLAYWIYVHLPNSLIIMAVRLYLLMNLEITHFIYLFMLTDGTS